MNNIDKEWEPVLIRLKSLVEEYGADPEVFCSRLFELAEEYICIYPDNRDKASQACG